MLLPVAPVLTVNTPDRYETFLTILDGGPHRRTFTSPRRRCTPTPNRSRRLLPARETPQGRRDPRGARRRDRRRVHRPPPGAPSEEPSSRRRGVRLAWPSRAAAHHLRRLLRPDPPQLPRRRRGLRRERRGEALTVTGRGFSGAIGRGPGGGPRPGGGRVKDALGPVGWIAAAA